MPEKKILVIDSDTASRNFVARHLIGQKYEVIQAGSGKEGLIYAWRDHPILAVIDPNIADITGEELARKLKQDTRTANMPLIALSSSSSTAWARSCLDAGFGDFIPKSGQAMPVLIATINRLLGVSELVAKRGGLLMLFQSAKGGAGTSSLCANLAMNIGQTQPQARVAVVDMVQPIGSIASIVGYEGQQNIVTVTDLPAEEINQQFFRETLTKINVWHFYLLAGSPTPESNTHLKTGRIVDVISAIKEAYDYVLVDIGRMLSKFTLPLIQSADLNVLMVSTDASAVSLTKIVWEYLKDRDVNAASMFPIFNRTASLEGMSKAEVEKMIGLPIKLTVPYLGSNMALACSQHQPFTLKFPKDTTSLIFQEAAKEMSSLARKLRAE